MLNIIQKTKDDYNKIAKHFSATRNRIWPEFKEFTPYLRDGQRILDWGCGNGRLLMMIEGRKIQYVGVDQSIELLKQARRINQQAVKSGQAHFYSTANRDKKFPSSYFDMVFMIASFFHLPDEVSRKELLKKTWRELKSGGLLYISVWNLESDWAKQKKKNWKILGNNDYLIPWKNPSGKTLVHRYYHHFTKKELSKLLAQIGFTIERLSFVNFDGWTDDKGGRNLIVIASK